MTIDTDLPVLVTGGTGMQGRDIVAAVRRLEIPLRVLLLESEAHQSDELTRSGIETAVGDFESLPSLQRAMHGVRGVFSLHVPTPESEVHLKNLISAAQSEHVSQYVLGSVSGTGAHESWEWKFNDDDRFYWENKQRLEEMVTAADFPYWTITRPSMLMSNYLAFRSVFMHPDLTKSNTLKSAIAPDTRLAHVSGETVGLAVAQALREPERYNGQRLELADELLTLPEIAEHLSAALGRHIDYEHHTEEFLVADGQHAGLVRSQQWANDVGYPARPAMLKNLGLQPFSFREWANAHRDQI